MVKYVSIALIPLSIGSCCCKQVTSGSSVRFLRGAKPAIRCHHVSLTGGLVARVYIGDPYFSKQKIEKKEPNPSFNFKTTPVYGLALEYNRNRLGFGLDYSTNKITANQTGKPYINYMMPSESQIIHRVNTVLTYKLPMLFQYKFRFYICLQPGLEWGRKISGHVDDSNTIWTHDYTPTFTNRVAGGVKFYLRSRWQFNVEAGYGAGVYTKAGIGWRIIRK